MNLNIKKRISWSFALLVLLFVANGIISIITLHENIKLSHHISTVIDPSLKAVEDFQDILIESKIYSFDLAFLRDDQADKNALQKLYASDYPKLKIQLSSLFLKLNDKSLEDSLNKAFTAFDQLIITEKKIMSSLQKFDNYDDPAAKFESQRRMEDEVLPRTTILMNSLIKIASYEQKIRLQKNNDLTHSLMMLQGLISALTITIICIGIFLSVYFTRIIISPVNKIKNIITDLSKGILRKVHYKESNDEIGEMIHSVNILSEKLQATAAFAAEIGNRNFKSYFEPLSSEDTLGKALITMRDNIKLSDEKLNDAQQIAHIGSWERNIKTNEINVSDEIFSIFDIDAHLFDFRFQSIMKFIHPGDMEYAMRISRENQYLPPVPYECRIVTSKGVIKNLWVETKVILGKYGEIEKTFGIAQDITERKRSEEKLAGERELLRLMIETLPDQIYLKDTESRFILCNKSVATNAGCSSHVDMIGKTDFDFLPTQIAKQCFIDEQTIIQSGIPLINHEEHMVDTTSGKSRWSLSTKVPLINNAGNMIGLIGINHDITERKIAEKELESVNRELSMLFNSIDEIFFSVNMATLKVIQISATCEKLYGYKQSEFLANYMLWLDIIHPDDKHVIKNEDEEMRRGEQVNNQYRIIRKDKIIRWVETKITPTLDKDRNLIRVDGVTRDITKRKNAEDELYKSEERYRQIVETAQEGIWLINENNYIIFFNKKMCEILGYSADEMKGKQLFDFMDDEGKKNSLSQIENRKQKINGNYDVKYITKSGRPIWTNISTNSIFGENGKYNGALAMVTDITQRKLDEELLLQSEINLAVKNKELERKNKELEQFAYVASHDMQEPLRTNISFVEIFKKQYFGKLDSKADTYLNYITQASQRMSVLIKDLLDFSRIGINKDIEQVDCNATLRNVITDIDKALQDSHAEIESESLPCISGYSTELKQLFQNLILNSIKFRKKDVPLKINISAHKKNDYWQFAFTDNGIGIDQQYSERIFIIFQRLHTRAEYEGSGIGLSHCKKIVELHHGKIWVESTSNEGSTFYFTIYSPKQKINAAKVELHIAC